MTDNRTTELLPCPFCGGEAKLMHMDLDSIEEGWQVWGVWCVDDLHAEEHGGYQHGHCIDNYATAEEAIAAWNARAELGSGTLTAEQVREAIEENSWKEAFMLREFNESSWQAIADELNEALGGGECDAILDESYCKGIHGYCEGLKCSNCGEPLFSEFKSCPWCGKRIRKKVGE